MKKIKKAHLVSASIGAMLGIILLIISLSLNSFDKSSSLSKLGEEVTINVITAPVLDNLLIPALSLFGFNVDELTDNESNGILSALENIKVRIVAHSKVGNELHTLLEVVSPKETKRLVVKEGITVNGFLIKSINNRQLILQKNSVEYIIKLFHSKELNESPLKQIKSNQIKPN